MFLESKQLDKMVPIPLYFQLKELIVNEIKSGKYETESLIPTEKELSDQFAISRTTVRQAITELVQEGWLYRVKSKGTFIAKQKINQDFMQKLESFPEQMARLGMSPSTEVLEFEVREAGKNIAENLNLNEGDKVIYLHRRRFGDGEPLVVLETYLPYEECSFILEHDFSKESLYKVLSEREDSSIYSVKRVVEAVEATSEDVKYMQIKKGKPIQLFHTIGYTPYGIPLEYSIARYRGDRNSFMVTVFTEINDKK